MKEYNKENIPFAKMLRRNMTPWERKLWYAQGLLQASKVYSCFTKQEQNAIENILDRV